MFRNIVLFLVDNYSHFCRSMKICFGNLFIKLIDTENQNSVSWYFDSSVFIGQLSGLWLSFRINSRLHRLVLHQQVIPLIPRLLTGTHPMVTGRTKLVIFKPHPRDHTCLPPYSRNVVKKLLRNIYNLHSLL